MCKPRDVPAGTGKAFNEAYLDRIGLSAHHNDGNRLGRILGRLDSPGPSCYHDDINLETHQLSRKLGEPIELPLHISVLDGDVLSFYVAKLAQSQSNSFGTGGLHVPAGPLMLANVKRTIGFAIKSRLPSMYISREAVEAGGLMSYGAHLGDSYRLVAWYVDKILKGAKPADLPVQQPMIFEFVINLNTAKQIGLTIPQWTLMKADRVIK